MSQRIACHAGIMMCGVLFCWGGARNIIDPSVTWRLLGQFMPRNEASLLVRGECVVGIGVAEIWLGAALLTGHVHRCLNWIAAAALLLFSVILGLLWASGSDAECGCPLSVGRGPLMYASGIARNMLMLAAIAWADKVLREPPPAAVGRSQTCAVHAKMMKRLE